MKHVKSSRTSECADGANDLGTSLLGPTSFGASARRWSAEPRRSSRRRINGEHALLPDDIAKTAGVVLFCPWGSISFWERERRDSIDPDPSYGLGNWSTENRDSENRVLKKLSGSPGIRALSVHPWGRHLWVTHPDTLIHYVFGRSAAELDGATGILFSTDETFKSKSKAKSTRGRRSGCLPYRLSPNYPWLPTPDDLDPADFDAVLTSMWVTCTWVYLGLTAVTGIWKWVWHIWFYMQRGGTADRNSAVPNCVGVSGSSSTSIITFSLVIPRWFCLFVLLVVMFASSSEL